MSFVRRWRDLSTNTRWFHAGRGMALTVQKKGKKDYRLRFYVRGECKGETKCPDVSSCGYFATTLLAAITHLADTIWNSGTRVRVPNRAERRALKKRGVVK